MTLKNLIKISRPRFWLYAGGTFIVGAVAGASSIYDLANVRVMVFLLYFIIPANIFIYGINDLYDTDTDPLNPKKGEKEHLLKSAESKVLRLWVYVCILLGIQLIFWAPNLPTKILIGTFLFLAWAYSSNPFRFKAKPFIDALSNVHYAVIGFAGYSMLSGEWPPLWAVIAAWSWTASMHIFSAIPDIEADAEAKLTTTAIFFGHTKSFILCSLLWVVTGVSLYFGDFYSPLSLIITAVYIVVPLPLIAKPRQTLVRVYWYFPIINGVVGFILFWAIALKILI